MKKIYVIFVIVFFMTFFYSCSKEITVENKVVINYKISEFIPLEITTNFNYTNLKIKINGSPKDFEKSSGSVFLKNLDYGENEITIEFFDARDVSLMVFEDIIFFDNKKPNISILKKELINGKLNTSFNFDKEDFNYAEIFLNGEIIKVIKEKDFIINLEKNTGINKFKIVAFDSLQNFCDIYFEIDTNEDLPPKIHSNNFRMNLFSEYNLDTVDDWEENLTFFIKKNDKIFQPYEVLLDNFNSATIIAFDSNKNKTEKNMPVFFDSLIPSRTKVYSRLLSKDVGYFSWEYDPQYNNYVIEKYNENVGWYSSKKTESSFIRIEDDKIFYVRKLSNNSSYGFPSAPVFLFSDRLLPLGTGIIPNITENTLLTQINSPFIIASDMIIDENKTLFIESGSELRFFAQSRMVVRGTLFIMPGAINTKLFGDGTIILDGGSIIISNTDIDNIEIRGNSGQLIFLESINYSGNYNINLNNIGRISFYDSYFNNNSITVNNTQGIFIDASFLNNVYFHNISEVLLNNSKFKSYNSFFKTRTVAQNSIFESITLKDVSYFYSIKNSSEIVDLFNFSMLINNNSSFNFVRENGGVFIE